MSKIREVKADTGVVIGLVRVIWWWRGVRLFPDRLMMGLLPLWRKKKKHWESSGGRAALPPLLLILFADIYSLLVYNMVLIRRKFQRKRSEYDRFTTEERAG